MLFGWITPAFAGAGASFDVVRQQPTGQPETVAAGLEGDRNPGDVAAGLLCLRSPAMQQPQQPCFVRFQLLCRVPLDPRDHAGDEPARLAHLDHGNQRAILVKSGERSAQCLPRRRPGSFGCGMGHPVGFLQRR